MRRGRGERTAARGAGVARRDLSGYRGILAVVLVLGLVVVSGATGVARRALCLVDASLCQTAASTDEPGASPSVPEDQLPAASDELVVGTGAGVGSVAAGLGVGAADSSGTGPGALRDAGSLWQPREPDPVGVTDESVLLPLGALPCGGPGTGPCDEWDGLVEDSASTQMAGASRLSTAGLDPLLGREDAAEVVTVSVDPSVDALWAAPTEADLGLRYRLSTAVRDGATLERWTWKESRGETETLLRVEASRTGGGELHSVVIARVRTGERPEWVTASIPATDATRAALDSWLSGLSAGGGSVPDEVLEPTDPPSVTTPEIVRVAYAAASVSRLTLTPSGSGRDGRVDAERLDDGLEAEGTGLEVVSEERLAAPDRLGFRGFVEVKDG